MAFHRILVAVDEGPVARHAAEVAVSLAGRLEASMAFVHVVDSASDYAADVGLARHDLERAARQEAEAMITALCRQLGAPAGSAAITPFGGAASEIARAARDWSADLIVIGSHGRSGVQRALLGSVAENVMRHATCAVLVVRPT